MSAEFAARCGIYCGDCEYREKMSCPGCIKCGGKVFWGECDVAKCCIERGLDHCGQCEDVPCEMLRRFAYDPEEGDDGQRIRNVQAWQEKGVDAWLKERGEG